MIKERPAYDKILYEIESIHQAFADFKNDQSYIDLMPLVKKCQGCMLNLTSQLRQDFDSGKLSKEEFDSFNKILQERFFRVMDAARKERLKAWTPYWEKHKGRMLYYPSLIIKFTQEELCKIQELIGEDECHQ